MCRAWYPTPAARVHRGAGAPGTMESRVSLARARTPTPTRGKRPALPSAPERQGRTHMHGVREIVRHEGGVAVVLALVALLPLTALVVVLLTMSAFEPQIASNLAATNQAQYLAEAGIEAAFDALASTVNWSAVLAGPPAATCTVGVVAPGTVQGAVLPGLSASAGTYTVRVRNDCFSNARSNPSSDSALTGVPLDASATVDTNDRLILTSTGTIGTAMRTNTVVIRKVSFPPIRAALAFPGVGAHVDFSGSFAIRGVDTHH